MSKVRKTVINSLFFFFFFFFFFPFFKKFLFAGFIRCYPCKRPGGSVRLPSKGQCRGQESRRDGWFFFFFFFKQKK